MKLFEMAIRREKEKTKRSTKIVLLSHDQTRLPFHFTGVRVREEHVECACANVFSNGFPNSGSRMTNVSVVVLQ